MEVRYVGHPDPIYQAYTTELTGMVPGRLGTITEALGYAFGLRWYIMAVADGGVVTHYPVYEGEIEPAD
jgi:hypothetical protein